MVYGYPLVLPGQFQDPVLPPPPACQRGSIPRRERSYADAVRGSSVLDGATFVYVRQGSAGAGPLREVYAGPYEVLRRSEKVFELQIRDCVETVAADRLKQHSGVDPVPALPPRRGRPPGSGGSGSPGSGSRLEGGPVAAAENL